MLGVEDMCSARKNENLKIVAHENRIKHHMNCKSMEGKNFNIACWNAEV